MMLVIYCIVSGQMDAIANVPSKVVNNFTGHVVHNLHTCSIRNSKQSRKGDEKQQK
ncbi:hypothetical protein KIN20_000150 [Parelaphostrongylus tenuis]|uniref:Uncharacterized protein n=1 Tax=Parelaphostrongylus tenuis TaxID=148309 RepID=A0AAD5QBA1_PARTN|nr:hypothetical protein KIN20_000150 [Parelaphostrongylus tenuis]